MDALIPASFNNAIKTIITQKNTKVAEKVKESFTAKVVPQINDLKSKRAEELKAAEESYIAEKASINSRYDAEESRVTKEDADAVTAVEGAYYDQAVELLYDSLKKLGA